MTLRRTLRAAAIAALALPAVAQAEPTPLAPSEVGDGIVLSGDSVLRVREDDRRGTVTAIPGGRVVHRYGARGADRQAGRLAASATTAALVVIGPAGGSAFGAAQVFSGSPTGPLGALGPRRRFAPGSYLPFAAEVDGDRVFLVEIRSKLSAGRLSVVEPGSAPRPLALPQSATFTSAFAGDLVAYPVADRAARRGDEPRARRLVVADWRTGAVRWSADVGDEVETLDLRPDGRAVAKLDDEGIVEVAPGGTAVRRLDRDGEGPRFAGEAIVFTRQGRRSGGDERLLLAEPGRAPRPFGVPSAAIGEVDADERRVVWEANDCLLSAPVGEPAAVAAAPGPCARSEVVLDDDDQPLISPRARRVPLVLRCVAAPPPGCRGTARLTGEFDDSRGSGTTSTRARFLIPAGERRRLTVRLSPRGYRAALRDARSGLGGAAFVLTTVTTDPDGRRKTASDLYVALFGPQED